uniref:Uncharacterized protein n=1 Tax=Canis lupus dingo TaxID=286419 RepID=A0A8C0LBU8_CANLU
MPEEAKPDSKTLQVLRDMANRLRIHSIRATCRGGAFPVSGCARGPRPEASTWAGTKGGPRGASASGSKGALQ